MKRIYIFDMGGVLVRNHYVIPDIADYLKRSEDEVLTWGKELFYPLMEGKLSGLEFWAQFSKRSGQQVQVDEELFGKFFKPVRNESVYELIRRLKQRSRVICGTNTITEHYDIHCQRGDYDIFDMVYASHVMGYVKPHPEFYHHILQQESIAPSQAVFIDDKPENVEAAAKLGIQAIHFTSPESLRVELEALQ